MEFHEAANIFPLDEKHLSELAEDIRQFGQKVTIETLDGKILDGRRRFKACQLAGVEPRFVAVNPDDPVAYVLSLNQHRRHLTPSQRAMVGARAKALKEKYTEEAKKRMSAGGKAAGKGRPKQGVENFPHPVPDAGKTRDAIGKALDVSGKTIDHATKVLNNAVPEVVQAVDEGRMAVSTAAILSTEPEEVQREEAASPKRKRKYTPGPNGTGEPTPTAPEEEAEEDGKPKKGVGIDRANEAINCLMRIPKNDHFRKRGFQIVTDWIRHNK